jgi:hypothetical protein
MSKLTLSTPKDVVVFGEEFLPPASGFKWRLAGPEEESPLKAPTATNFGAFAGQFRDAGLRLPVDPILVELMARTNVPFSWLAPNVIRTVAGVKSLNKKLEINLGLKEIIFCLKFIRRQPQYFFSPQEDAPELVKALPSSGRGPATRLVAVTAGPVLPEGFEGFSFPQVTEKLSKYPWIAFFSCLIN